ncbi:MAG TPA: hypothetical protein VF096_04010 [Azonexus sp.]
MPSLFRSVVRLLLLVLLASVLVPAFAGMAAAEARVAGYGTHVGEPAGHQAAADDCGECAELRHHCCPGFGLGQLAAVSGATFLPAHAAGASPRPVAGAARFASRVPDGPERPPRSAA